MVIAIIMAGNLRRFPMLIRQGLTMFGALLVAVPCIACGQVDPTSQGEKPMTQPQNQQTVIGRTEIATDLDHLAHAAWSPDNKYFAVIGSKGSREPRVYSVLIYDANSCKMTQTLPIKNPGSILGVIAFSPDGKYLAAGIGVITLWDTRTWQAVRDIEGPYERGFAAGGAKSIAFSPDSKSLTVLYDSVVWPETLRIPTREEAANWNRKEAAARKDGTFMEKRANGEVRSFLRTIMSFEVETTKRIFVQTSIPWTPKRNGWFTGNLAYTPDGRYLLTLREEHLKLESVGQGRIRTFIEFRDPLTGTISKEIEQVHVMEITSVAISPNGRVAATGTMTLAKESQLNEYTKQWDYIDNKDPVRLWDLASGNKVMEYGPLRGGVKELAFSPNGNLLVSCQADRENKETIWIWDVKSGKLIERVNTPRSGTEIFGCAISPDGQIIVVPMIDTIYLFRLQE